MMSKRPTALITGASGGLGAEVAREGYRAMRAGKAVCLQGALTKAMSIGSRLVPRSIARKLAKRMNR